MVFVIYFSLYKSYCYVYRLVAPVGIIGGTEVCQRETGGASLVHPAKRKVAAGL